MKKVRSSKTPHAQVVSTKDSACPSFTVADIAERVGARVLCADDAEQLVCGVASPVNAGPQHISYLSDGFSMDPGKLASVKAGAVLVSEKLAPLVSCATLVCANPRLAFAQITQLFRPSSDPKWHQHTNAVVDPSASVHAQASLGPHSSVAAAAQIAAGVRIGPGCHIGERCTLAEGVVLHAGVVLYPDVHIGARCEIHSNSTIGADGFGFERNADGHWIKIVHTGGVILGEDVEVGANCTIDAGTLDPTRLGNRIKLDDQVHIGHNCDFGDDCVLAGQTGIGGSVRLGRGCMMGGKGGAINSVTLADGVWVAPMSFAFKSCDEEGGRLSSFIPALPHKEWMSMFKNLKKLGKS